MIEIIAIAQIVRIMGFFIFFFLQVTSHIHAKDLRSTITLALPASHRSGPGIHPMAMKRHDDIRSTTGIDRGRRLISPGQTRRV